MTNEELEELVYDILYALPDEIYQAVMDTRRLREVMRHRFNRIDND